MRLACGRRVATTTLSPSLMGVCTFTGGKLLRDMSAGLVRLAQLHPEVSNSMARLSMETPFIDCVAASLEVSSSLTDKGIAFREASGVAEGAFSTVMAWRRGNTRGKSQ